MDYAKLICDPIYAAFGGPAVLITDHPDASPIVITVMERTTSAGASAEFEPEAPIISRNELYIVCGGTTSAIAPEDGDARRSRA